MAARRRVFFHDQNGSPPVCCQAITLGRKDALKRCVQMLHRHEFRQVIRIGIEAPGIDNLLTMGVDDLDRLPLGQTDGPAPARRHNMKVRCHLSFPLPIALSDKTAGYIKGQIAQFQFC
jgi:hypothetical protein